MVFVQTNQIIIVGTGFEHYSYEMSEFKPNELGTINL